jgi:hypothetical protein
MRAIPTYAENLASSTARLQSAAWTACNASYHEPDPDLYRAAGRMLYRRATQEQIKALFARSDQQNARLDAMTRLDAQERADGAQPNVLTAHTARPGGVAGAARSGNTHGCAV